MREGKAARGMQVLTSDGEFLGTVDKTAPDGLIITRTGSGAGSHAAIPELWIAEVDDFVRLNRTGGEAAAGWKAMQFQVNRSPSEPEHGKTPAQNRNWMWLVLLVLIALAIILLLALAD